MINQAQKIQNEIITLQRKLEQLQENCQHPNLEDDDNVSDDLFADPFAHDGVGFSGLVEYTCPDCLAIIVK